MDENAPAFIGEPEPSKNAGIGRRLRVGVVTTSFPVPINPASGIFVKHLVSHLPETVGATVLIPCPEVHAPPPPSGGGYKLQCFLYGPRRWLRLAHRPGGIPDALRRRDPALLLLPFFVPAMFIACLRLAGKVDVLHGNWSLPALIAAMAGKFRGRPAIATLRGEDITRAQHSRLFRWILGVSLSLNRRTVVVSASMHEDLRQRFPHRTDRIEFIPNGVLEGPSRVRPRFRSPLRLVTVGSLIRRKRIDTLLRALAHPDCLADTHLRIVGDGPEHASLRVLADNLGLGQRVDFTGGVLPDEVAAHLDWADLFVFASESEGRPNVILEAMAEGLPILATDIPGVHELIGSGAGNLFPVGDAPRLAGLIRAINLDPEKAQAMGREAKVRIQESGLTWTAAASRYAALYQQVSAEKGAA
jgi:glycosyltransferase involved in cell wall biosynthesis